jgi:signal transduction histidine kinase/ligand-binding sensor domain-containing protein
MICRPIDFLVSLGMEQPCHERRMESEGLRHSVGACGVAERVRSGRRKAALLTRSSLQPIGRVACWTWLLSGACTGLVLGQGAESGHTAERSSFIVKHWTSENDLPQNKVSCLKRTRDGYLWIGTYFGLVRFDGVHFATFSPMNASEMTNETINALAEDTEGKLWIGTEKGLFSYQAHQFRAVPAQNKLAGKPITGLTAARSGGIWIQTDDGVGKISTGVPAQFWEIDVKDQIRSIKESADGSLNVFMRKSWLVLTEKDGEWQTNWTAPGPEMYCLAACPAAERGTAWIGTKNGIYLCSNHVCRPFGKGQETNAVNLVYRGRSGELWLSYRGGGSARWDGARWQEFSLEGGAGNQAVCFEQDAEGSMWVGAAEGLYQLREPLVRTFDTYNGLLDDRPWSICQANDGTIWVGSEHGLSSISEDERARPWGSGSATERCVWPHPQDGIWTSRTSSGLYEVHNGRPAQVASSNVFPGSITCLWDDGAGRLFVGTEGKLLVFRDTAPRPWTSAWTNYPVRDVRSILKDREGNLWLGTANDGVVQVRRNKTEHFTTKTSDGLSGNKVWSILEDTNGIIWLATETGLTRWKEGKFFAFTRRRGLLENPVNCVLDDGAGFLWLSGLRGLYRISRQELNAVADGKAASVEPFVIGTPDGMQSAESNGEKQPSGWKARDGRLWFPTTHGVVVVDPKAIPAKPTPTTPVIQQVKSDGAVIFGEISPDESRPRVETGPRSRSDSGKGPIRIPPGGGRLEFRFGSTSLVASDRNRFRYRLVGADPDWREPTPDRVAHYNLHPGRYQFEVAAADYHNVWSPAAAVFPFYLAPHFWQTWTFYAACAVGLVGLAAAIQAYRLRWQRRLLKLEEQEALATERTRIARDLHDDLGTALTGLALQLDVAGRDAKPSGTLAERLSQAARHTRELAERMREVVWTVNPGCDNVSSLVDFLEQQVSQFLRSDSVQVRFDFPDDIPDLPLSGAVRHHLALSVREALTNVVRHARASQVTLGLVLEDKHLIVQVRDNGCGMQPAGRQGNGLKNMRTRLEQIGGSFDWQSEPDRGTTITFRVPLPESHANKRLNHE